MRGTIKKCIRERGFGFIAAENGNEVFFHSSGLQGIEFDSLKEGTKVEFTVEQGQKGPRAVNVKISE